MGGEGRGGERERVEEPLNPHAHNLLPYTHTHKQLGMYRVMIVYKHYLYALQKARGINLTRI